MNLADTHGTRWQQATHNKGQGTYQP